MINAHIILIYVLVRTNGIFQVKNSSKSLCFLFCCTSINTEWCRIPFYRKNYENQIENLCCIDYLIPTVFVTRNCDHLYIYIYNVDTIMIKTYLFIYNIKQYISNYNLNNIINLLFTSMATLYCIQGEYIASLAYSICLLIILF